MKITRKFSHTDRYVYDFNLCKAKDGWAQVDTGQDAHYYGNWANPFSLKIISYAEGDVVICEAETVEEFVQEIRKMEKFQNETGWGCKIDGMCNERIIEKFKEVGLGDMLH